MFFRNLCDKLDKQNEREALQLQKTLSFRSSKVDLKDLDDKSYILRKIFKKYSFVKKTKTMAFDSDVFTYYAQQIPNHLRQITLKKYSLSLPSLMPSLGLKLFQKCLPSDP